MDIISKLKKSGLTGRGGAGFPTYKKWEMVRNAKGEKKFVVANASEGEPGIKKDHHILKNHPDKVVAGMKIALEYLEATAGYIYINPEYFNELEATLENAIDRERIELFAKPHMAGYVGGEETSVLNALEGRRIEPRLRPPWPTTNGLWNYPTLVNNVETFYGVALIAADRYDRKRFYTINGDCLWTGVYELPEAWTVAKILQETKNYPDFKFFVQVGGDAGGEILNKSQLDKQATGGGSITVYSILKHNPTDLIKKLVGFFLSESCGQCTPCREGIYRLNEVINSAKFNREIFNELIENLSATSFCALGSGLPLPLKSFLHNVLPLYSENYSFLK